MPWFKWRQTVSSPIGKHDIELEGCLPASVEHAVAALIERVKEQADTIARLEAEVAELRGRATTEQGDDVAEPKEPDDRTAKAKSAKRR